MKTLSIDTHPHDPAADQELYDLLKEAEDTTPATSTGDNEGETTVGVNPDAYPDPEDRGGGSIDASWGEETGDGNDATHFSNEAFAQFKQSREKMLADLFDGVGDYNDVEQKTMGQHLSHAASGQFGTSSPQLSSKSKDMPKASSVQPETLMEMTRRVAGRH